jgi:hypothetical protein
MSESKPIRHPFFDPASTYCRMRKSARPEYKMRGYFHWQKARAIRLGLPPGTRELKRHIPAGIEVTDAVDVRPVCLLGELRYSVAVESLFLARESDGTRTVGMFVTGSELESHQPVCCRAFLIEPEVLARLQEVVGEVDPDNAISRAFTAETIATNLELARLLAAIPDLDGEVQDREIRFHRLPIADEFDTFPPRPGPLMVVLVCDNPTAL